MKTVKLLIYVLCFVLPSVAFCQPWPQPEYCGIIFNAHRYSRGCQSANVYVDRIGFTANNNMYVLEILTKYNDFEGGKRNFLFLRQLMPALKMKDGSKRTPDEMYFHYANGIYREEFHDAEDNYVEAGGWCTFYLYYKGIPDLSDDKLHINNREIDYPFKVDKTDWDEAQFSNMRNQLDGIEGVYDHSFSTDLGNHYTFGIKMVEDGVYSIIYLNGDPTGLWRQGEEKGRFTMLAPDVFRTEYFYKWDKTKTKVSISFDYNSRLVLNSEDNRTTEYSKRYPLPKAGNSSSASSTSTNANELKSTGSGIFVGPKVIATNYHVVNGANKIEISINSEMGIITCPAKVICTDKTNDLALVQIEDSKFRGFSSLPYNLYTKIQDVGTSIFTMGYPMANVMGEEVKVTDGIISSKTGYDGDIVTYQISAAIQPGNSGGALFDKKGNLIGITNAGIPSAQNVGYAIKSSYLMNIMDAAPVELQKPSNNMIGNLPFSEQIKVLSKYVVFIKIY